MTYCIDREQKKIILLSLDDVRNAKSITVLCNDFASDSYLKGVAFLFT